MRRDRKKGNLKCINRLAANALYILLQNWNFNFKQKYNLQVIISYYITDAIILLVGKVS